MGTRYKGSLEEMRALSAFINLMRAADSVAARSHKHLSGKDLTLSQFGVLEALLHCGPMTQGELAGKLLRSCGSVTSVVDILERRGLVDRERSEEDRRLVRAKLTAEGYRLIKGIFPEHVRTVLRQFKVLTAAEQEALRRLCRKVGLGER